LADLKPAYLIAGGDWPKVDAAIARLRAHFPEEAVEQLSAGGEQPVDVVGACNALGLFGGRRLVLVRNAEELDDEAVAGIVAYLSDPAPDTVLALFGSGKITPKHAFDAPERKQAADWVVRRLADRGVGCSAAVARRLVDLAGDDVGDLAVEVEKLASYCANGEARVEDVELLVIAQPDIKPWDITDAWGRRDAPSVISLATADVERPEDVGRLIAQLASHVRKVHRAAVILDEGGSQADVARDLNMKPFPAGKLVGQARSFARDELGRAVVRLADLDLAVKGGSRLDARFELELALAEITSG
jgi:DNA polymerase III subunit delta